MTTTTTETSLTVSEVFGPTFQGEGPGLGKRAAFIRLGGCNLHCAWCDTPYTWDASRFTLRDELHRQTVASILEQVDAMTPHTVVITGGEPLLQQAQPAFLHLLEGLVTYRVEIETNGTQVPTEAWAVDCFNVSPKLAHGGDPTHLRIVPAALQRLAELSHDRDRAVLKVVCQTPEDVAETRHLADAYGWPLHNVYVMAEGTTVNDILTGQRRIVDAALEHGVGMTTRLHTMIWGQERGR